MKISIYILDPKLTHEDNMQCRQRLLQKANGQWYCIDCGLYILHSRIDGHIDDIEDNIYDYDSSDE